MNGFKKPATYRAVLLAYNRYTGEKYELKDRPPRTGLTLEQAAELAQVEPEDITWAIEEYGEFQVMDNPQDPMTDWEITEEERK